MELTKIRKFAGRERGTGQYECFGRRLGTGTAREEQSGEWQMAEAIPFHIPGA